MKFDIDTIKIGNRKRQPANINDLANSIHQVGLINPITIDREFNLVAGANRLEACRKLGWTQIDCHVLDAISPLTLELAEIDENLIRTDLTVLEQASWMKRRKEIYLELYPQTAKGAGKGNQHTKSTEGQLDILDKSQIETYPTQSSFVDSTSDLTGKSKATVSREVQIATELEDYVEDLASLPIANEKTNLLSLAQVAKDSPDKIDEVVAELTANPDIPAKEIIDKHRPHVVNNSGENEWYTPTEYIEAARRVLGEIDLDPASCNLANKTVLATKFFSKEDNGLEQRWQGRIWLNPPYSNGLITPFVEKYTRSVEAGDILAGIVLVNNGTETQWFQQLASVSTAICFPRSRIRFVAADGETKNSPIQGQAFLYFGDNLSDFAREFRNFGCVLQFLGN